MTAMSDKLPVGIDVDESGTTRLIQRLRDELEAAQRSTREMHIAADNFLRERDALRATLDELKIAVLAYDTAIQQRANAAFVAATYEQMLSMARQP